jgi:hypothetical protein
MVRYNIQRAARRAELRDNLDLKTRKTYDLSQSLYNHEYIEQRKATETVQEKEARLARQVTNTARYRTKQKAEDPKYIEKDRAFGKDYKDRKRAADPDWDEKENAKRKARDRKKQHEKTMQGGQQTLMGIVTKNANTKDIANDEDIADDEVIANTKPQPLKDITKTVNNNGRRPGLYHSAPESHTTEYQEYTKNVSRILPDLSARIPDHYTMAHGAVVHAFLQIMPGLRVAARRKRRFRHPRTR